MTKSFLSYVDLKKQAMKDLESEPDLEMGKLGPADEQNLTQFFKQVTAIKADMEQNLTNLLLDLQDLNEETKFTHTAKGKAELAMENQERHEALKDLQRSLTELHQVFLDMAVMVVKQGEQMDDIEQNVAELTFMVEPMLFILLSK
ncbi:unnamed protein product [Prunus brigantina]